MMEATRREEIGTANSEAAQPAPAAASASAAAAEDDDDDDSEGGLEAQESIGVPISHEYVLYSTEPNHCDACLLCLCP